MQLDKWQRQHIKDVLLPYFKDLPEKRIEQARGHFAESTKELFFKEIKECGVCFGVHLAVIYGEDYGATNASGYYIHKANFFHGEKAFLKALGIEEDSKEKRELFNFMHECGASEDPFSPDDWHEHPKVVLENMLKRGSGK